MNHLSIALGTKVEAQTLVEADAVGVFLNRYRDMSVRVAKRIVLDTDLAEDVAQEALIRAYRSWDRVSKADSQVAWVRRIVVRCALTAIERRRESTELFDHPANTDLERDTIVADVLDRLPADHRIILGLAIGENLSYAEMSDALDIPEGTVASRLNAAKAAFRRAWEGSR